MFLGESGFFTAIFLIIKVVKSDLILILDDSNFLGGGQRSKDSIEIASKEDIIKFDEMEARIAIVVVDVKYRLGCNEFIKM